MKHLSPLAAIQNLMGYALFKESLVSLADALMGLGLNLDPDEFYNAVKEWADENGIELTTKLEYLSIASPPMDTFTAVWKDEQ